MDTDKIDALLSFLPRFEQPDRPFVSGSDYAPDVVEFFKIAEDCRRPDHDPVEAGWMLDSDRCIQEASLDQVREMLAYCVRGEQYSAGHWEHLLSSGTIPALLRRLQQLRQTLDA